MADPRSVLVEVRRFNSDYTHLLFILYHTIQSMEKDPAFLKSKQDYVIRKVNSIMRSHPSIKYDIRFRSGKVKTAGTVLTDPKTHFRNFVFSNYWIKAFFTYELLNLIKHECAHALTEKEGGHGPKFVATCKKIGCASKWQRGVPTSIDVYASMLKR